MSEEFKLTAGFADKEKKNPTSLDVAQTASVRMERDIYVVYTYVVCIYIIGARLYSWLSAHT